MTPRENRKAQKKEIEARFGLRLAPDVLAALSKTGIYCNADISIVHQQMARRYVLRGEESGGAVSTIGAYTSFVSEDGKPLSWLQPVETVGPNGRHAIVIAPSFVRLQMVRVEHTYDFLITRHRLVLAPGRTKPTIDSTIVFKARQGTLALDLWDKDATSRGGICPVFYSFAGDALTIPTEFQEATFVLTAAVCCVGCHHVHLLQPPAVDVAQVPEQTHEATGVAG
ncbi:MAG TPA: hypothetical protein VFK06_17715 [Candidatus Angelobacter sp.]|nr:hypothetical protein [Candidatus Angelobacter sp.]